MKRTVLILSFLLCIVAFAAAQKFSNKGTEFWAGFGHQGEMELTAWLDTPRLALMFSAEQKAKVTVTIEGTAYKQEYNVPANSVIRTLPLPQGFRDRPASAFDVMLYTRTSDWPNGTNSEGIFKNKGVHISSDVPIVAYAHLYGPASSAATMLMPADSWGYSYLGLTAKQAINVAAGGDEPFDHSRFSWMFFIANKNDTRIRIVPPVPTRSGAAANTPIEITLQKGEIYQLLAGEESRGNMYDLTGTTANAIANSEGKCLPFAAFVGSSGMYVACNDQSTGGGHATEENLMQQMFPKHAWGKRYLATPTSVDAQPTMNNYNIFRILVSDATTIVKKNGVVLTGATNNFFEYRSNTADYIEADKPIQVAQMMPSQGRCGYSGSGDPEMTFLSPIEQGIKRIGFYRNDKTSIDWNFLTLTIPTAGINSLTIDGKKDFSNTYAHPNLPGYSVVVRRWNTRSNTDQRAPAQCIVQSDSAFNAITYGMGQAESYAYNAGTYLNNLSGIADYKNEYNTADTSNTYTCAQTPVQLSVLMRYKPTRMEWKFSEMAGKITPATDVVVDNPVLVGEQLVAGVTYYKYTLPGTYVFSEAGYHIVPLYTTHPSVDVCNNTEQIQYEVIVEKAIKTDFSILYQNCRAQELISFEADDKYTDGTEVKRWEWEFMNGAVSASATGQQVKQLFDKGDHSARLIAVDKNGCIADTIKQFTLADKPAVPAFSASSAAICEKAESRFTENTPLSGIKEWFWSFGDGTTATVTNNGYTQAHTYTSSQTGVVVKHVVKFSSTCVSDTAYQTIAVYAKPKLSVGYPAGCLPENGRVAFDGQAATADGQAVNIFNWNFGDAASTADNPNTATVANPSHIFSAGSYTITYSATSARGCVGDTVIKATFNPRPAISYPAVLPAVCVNAKLPVSVAQATVTNGIAGNGYYKGTGVAGNGDFNPAVATPGVHTIWYVFASDNGCIDSVSASITVKPKPEAKFSYEGMLCAKGSVTIRDLSSLAGGNVQTRKWSFGDGTVAEYTTAAAFTKVFNTAGDYTVRLIALGDNSCADTMEAAVKIHPLPSVDFTLPAFVCMPEGKASFTNKTASADGTALSYRWSFGDNSTAAETNPSHTYQQAGNYAVKLVATSAVGCVDSAQKVLSQFYDQPVADFGVNANTLCQGTPVRFTNNSTAPNSTVTAWAWSFGDGSTSKDRSPVKTYANAGRFTISLTVTNAAGCVSVPDNETVQVYLQPVVDAGPDIAAEEGEIVQLKAKANSGTLRFAWTPAQLVSNAAILQPTITVTEDCTLVLTATGENNCTASDEVQVVVQRPLVVPNVFTPNGDGINDTWLIKNLNMYSTAVIQLFNRYGQKVIIMKGDSKPWDGTVNGTPVPAGIYYYIIQLNNGQPVMNGSLTIIR